MTLLPGSALSPGIFHTEDRQTSESGLSLTMTDLFPFFLCVCCVVLPRWSEWVSEVAQSCPTLCDRMDCSLPDSSVHGIFQARVLKWVAISFSRRCSRPRGWTWVSHIVGRCFTVWATRETPSQVVLVVKKKKKNPPANAGDTRNTGSIPVLGKMPWSRKWYPTPVFLPGEFCGQRSLEGYMP